MKISRYLIFISMIIASTALGGITNLVLAQSNDTNQNQSSNTVSNVSNSTLGNPANMSNIITPGGESTTYR